MADDKLTPGERIAKQYTDGADCAVLAMIINQEIADATDAALTTAREEHGRAESEHQAANEMQGQLNAALAEFERIRVATGQIDHTDHDQCMAEKCGCMLLTTEEAVANVIIERETLSRLRLRFQAERDAARAECESLHQLNRDACETEAELETIFARVVGPRQSDSHGVEPIAHMVERVVAEYERLRAALVKARNYIGAISGPGWYGRSTGIYAELAALLAAGGAPADPGPTLAEIGNDFVAAMGELVDLGDDEA